MAQIGRFEFGLYEDAVLYFEPPYYGKIVPNVGPDFSGSSEATWAVVRPAVIGDITVTAMRPDGTVYGVLTPTVIIPTMNLLKCTIPKADFVPGIWKIHVDWGAAPVQTVSCNLIASWGFEPATILQGNPTVFNAANGKLTTYSYPSMTALFHQVCYSDLALTVPAISRASIIGYGPQLPGA